VVERTSTRGNDNHRMDAARVLHLFHRGRGLSADISINLAVDILSVRDMARIKVGLHLRNIACASMSSPSLCEDWRRRRLERRPTITVCRGVRFYNDLGYGASTQRTAYAQMWLCIVCTPDILYRWTASLRNIAAARAMFATCLFNVPPPPALFGVWTKTCTGPHAAHSLAAADGGSCFAVCQAGHAVNRAYRLVLLRDLVRALVIAAALLGAAMAYIPHQNSDADVRSATRRGLWTVWFINAFIDTNSSAGRGSAGSGGSVH